MMKSISRTRRFCMSNIFARRRPDRTPCGSHPAHGPISRSLSPPQSKREREMAAASSWLPPRVYRLVRVAFLSTALLLILAQCGRPH